MPSENRGPPKGVNMVLLNEVPPDPIGLMGQGLPKDFPEASGQGKRESNPLPWARDEAVPETVHSSRGYQPLCLPPHPDRSPPENISLRGSPWNTSLTV